MLNIQWWWGIIKKPKFRGINVIWLRFNELVWVILLYIIMFSIYLNSDEPTNFIYIPQSQIYIYIYY